MPSLSTSLRSNTFRSARREEAGRGSFFWHVAAVAAGLLVPCLIVVVGLIAMLLDEHGLKVSPVRLGTFLGVPIPDWFMNLPPLVQLTYLVGIALLLAILFSLAIWFDRNGADARSRAVTMKLHRDVFAQSMRRAEIEGAVAQRARAQMLIEQRLPQLGRGLSSWWRSMPRSILMVIGCVTVALLVNIPLASLAVISGLLLWQLYRALRLSIENETSAWETPRSRRKLVNLLSQSPLLARTQSGSPTDSAFMAELDVLYRRLEHQQKLRGRLWPIMALASSLAIALLMLGLGVNLFDDRSGLSLPAALVLGLSLTGAVAGSTRLTHAIGASVTADEAAHSVYQYMQIVDDAPPSEQRVGMAGLRDKVELVDVTLGDGSDTILSNVSLQLRPGSLVAILGTNSVSTLSLAELLLGIGRPGHGRIAIDGISLRDIHPRSLVKNVLWIGADGPLSEASVIDNIDAGHGNVDTHEIMQVTQRLGIYDALTRLSDGLQTILTPNDSRLSEEVRYAIGVARALMHKPPIIVVEEPPMPPDELVTDNCLLALRHLVDQNSLVLMLPKRLNTLRSADRVLLLNGPKIAGEGKHNELLQSSDLYRHLNYQLFNPYREFS
ncbi:MAG: ATP-binding cassette domain-containing protein [Planctomycetaceae bacterium]